ncbi:MAG: hypothetical protein MUP85_07025 [Candidatus Lokiarchaeota archaeon]|nr:hypothetical protein [Candidatus Lokiarchaeota archaeon]
MTIFKAEPNIIESFDLFVIPSWGNLLGYPTLGNYSNHNVSKISQDLVIFFSGLECSVQTEKGTLYYMFGLGYYYTKFELQSERYITDSRQLTGLILSDFVYDYLSTSKNITLENDRDIIVSENLFKLPIDLSFKSENKRTFIQGTLMRNLFIPYKDIILEFMETLRNPLSFQVNKTGPILLSTHQDSYNQILLSPKMDHEMKTKYLSPTAGLTEITFDSKRHLEQYFSHQNLQYIEELISKLKTVYSTIEYDPMYLFSILLNASARLRSGKGSSNLKKVERSNKKMPKESIFLSAEPRMNSIVDWPEMFRRRTKEELERSIVQVTSKLYQLKESDKKMIRVEEFREEQDQFKIRTMKRPLVGVKTLPIIPTSNSLDILLVIKDIVNRDYDIISIGRALEIARDYIKSMILHSNILWEMSKFVNLYQRSEPNVGLSPKEKFDFVEQIDKWINLISNIKSS